MVFKKIKNKLIPGQNGKTSIKILFLRLGHHFIQAAALNFVPREHWVVSGDIFGCHSWGMFEASSR